MRKGRELSVLKAKKAQVIADLIGEIVSAVAARAEDGIKDTDNKVEELTTELFRLINDRDPTDLEKDRMSW